MHFLIKKVDLLVTKAFKNHIKSYKIIEKSYIIIEQSLEIANLIGDKRGQGIQLGSLGEVYHKISKYDLDKNKTTFQRGNLKKSYNHFMSNPVGCVKNIDLKKILNTIKESI